MYSKPSFRLYLLFVFVPFIVSSSNSKASSYRQKAEKIKNFEILKFENKFNVASTSLFEDNYPSFPISALSLYNSFVGLLSQGYPDSMTAMDILLKMAAKAQNRTISKCHNYTEEYNNCSNNFSNKSCESVNEWKRQLRNLTDENNKIQDQVDNLTLRFEKNTKDLKNAKRLWKFKNYTLKYMLNKTENKTELVVKIISLLRSNYSINDTLSLLDTNVEDRTDHKLVKNLFTSDEVFTGFNQKFIKTFAKNKDFIKRVSLVKNIIIVLQNLLSKLQNKTAEIKQKINQTEIDFYKENQRLLNESDYLNSTLQQLKIQFDSNKKIIEDLTKKINDCGASPSNYEDCQDVFNEKAKKLNNKTGIYLKKIQEFVDKLQNFNRNQTKIIIEIKTCPLLNKINETNNNNSSNTNISENEENNNINETTNNTNETSLLSIFKKKVIENEDSESNRENCTGLNNESYETPPTDSSYDSETKSNSNSSNYSEEKNSTNSTLEESDLIHGEQEDENDDYFLKYEEPNTNDTKSIINMNNSNNKNTSDFNADADKRNEEEYNIPTDSKEKISKSEEESNIPLKEEYNDETNTNILKEPDENEIQDEETLNDLKEKINKIVNEEKEENHEEINENSLTEILEKKNKEKRDKKYGYNSRTHFFSSSRKKK